MTNTTYFYQVNRDYWSASTSTSTSTSASETPRHSDAQDTSSDAPSSSLLNDGEELRIFKYEELLTATRNFAPSNLLGEGAYGSVFKGWIDENKATASRPGRGLAVAVEMLSLETRIHVQELAEVEFFEQLCNPNLVKLFGYCIDDEHLLLVHEFMPQGSLDNHLFKDPSSLLNWSLRMKVALGAAKGLAFLHNAEPKLIHRDVKTAHILLDSNFNAKLSGFGLAMEGPTGDITHISTEVMGTYGYACPEYVATGHLSAKSDVYSFGVLLLEILSGRRAVDGHRATNEQNLVDWAKPYLGDKRTIFRVLDHHLKGKCSPRSAQKAANLVLHCLRNEANSRPNMDEVVTVLEQLIEEAGKL